MQSNRVFASVSMLKNEVWERTILWHTIWKDQGVNAVRAKRQEKVSFRTKKIFKKIQKKNADEIKSITIFYMNGYEEIGVCWRDFCVRSNT